MQIIKVKNADSAIDKAKSLLYKYCNSQTALFLSGGSTPKALYQTFSKEQKLKVRAVALVDERFGLPMHRDSNEKMISDTGLFDYFKSLKISIETILNGKDIENARKDYEEKIENLFNNFKLKIAILGIGENGHTAGIPAGFNNSKDFVVKIDNFPSKFKKRITLTFTALEKMDKLIVLVFGDSKKWALEEMFNNGPIEEIPARFYLKKEVSEKTILITDQNI
ncbi:MAG: hypothetical protein UR81_C0004G0011 [Candidatus Levybacteria bacterium GW2011_GWB1_35_5]|nr:MAG: hypothetical protein UR81_C0004G0011 [Candidatus Levybacteria bacterium GW2011_GWB1_35_5]